MLGIETSTHTGSVAVVEDDVLRGEITISTRPAHVKKLVPMIKSLLEFVEMDRAALDGIAVSAGPGYYTALRVGISTAKALSYSLELPLVGVSSLEVLARNVYATNAVVCAVIDAKMSQVYTAFFRFSDGRLIRCGDDMVSTPEEVLGMVEEETVFVGDVGPIEKALSKGVPAAGVVSLAPEGFCRPRASVCARLGARELAAGRAHDARELVPSYMRRAQAEISKEGVVT